MTAVDHAELKRLAEGATPGPWFRSETHMAPLGWTIHGQPRTATTATGREITLKSDVAVVRPLPNREANAAFIAAANPAVVLALLSEIEGLKAERDGLKAAWMAKHQSAAASEREAKKWFEAHQEACEALSEEANLRTQAPDSWRPSEQEVENVLRCCDAMERSVERKGLPKSEADICVATDWLRKVCAALRPQTAESGK